MHEGKHPDKRSISTAAKYGLDISKQRSRPILPKDFEEFDVIYCMDLSVFETVISMVKNEDQRRKIVLYLEEAGFTGDQVDVPDPYWGNLSDFENVYQLLDEAADSIVAKLVS